MKRRFEEKYVNPFTDYGFKRIFGESNNQSLLLDFLNELLKEEQGEIKSITYLNNEQLGRRKSDRKAVFDLYCENEKGERFIVELQKEPIQFFKERMLYYATFPIVDQAKSGPGWKFDLKAIYTIAILDFVFEDDLDEPDKYRYDIKLIDTGTCKVFYDKLTFIYLEVPKFNKTIDELDTRLDHWLFLWKNLVYLSEIPPAFKDPIFEKVFELAAISNFTVAQWYDHIASVKEFLDTNAILAKKFDDGLKKGLSQGMEEGIGQGEEKTRVDIAKRMMLERIPIPSIAQYTGLSEVQIKSLSPSP